MWEGENLDEGTTLKVYRFTVNGKDFISILPRTKGDRAEIGHDVVKKYMDDEREVRRAALEAFLKAKRWWKKSDKAQENILRGKLANVLFDFPEFEGEVLLGKIVADLLGAGLKKMSDKKASNGELLEEIMVFN